MALKNKQAFEFHSLTYDEITPERLREIISADELERGRRIIEEIINKFYIEQIQLDDIDDDIKKGA